MLTSWTRLQRETILKTPFIEVWEDTIKLPSGQIIDDYSVVSLPDGVLVIATDTEGRLLAFDEYKYATNQTTLGFPAGGIDNQETPAQAALRELREETGYIADEAVTLLGLDIYPSKIQHVVHIVRVTNARPGSEIFHESTEAIGEVQRIHPSELGQLVQTGRIHTTYALAALALTFPQELQAITSSAQNRESFDR